MNERLDSPVIIIGAGPVGLGMAIELSRRGIACTVVDEGNGRVEHPRTGLVAIRTMELLRGWGLSDAVRQCGFPPDYELSMVFCTALNGLLLDREPYPGMREAPTPPETPEKKQRCPQMWLQPILAEAAKASPLTRFCWRHRFESLSQDDSGVTAKLTDLSSGAQQTLRSRYLLGCDGVPSSVRRELGIEMEGRLLSYSINILLRAPDLARQHGMGEAERYMFVGPEGMWGNLTVVDGKDLWRLTVLGSETKMDQAAFDARHWVLRAFGTEAEPERIPFEVLSVIPWRRSEMLARAYGKGAVFLVGDAAHAMSPTGGMGMNTGMQEVMDLGWKLQGALQGWAGPQLLESYGIERRPIAARAISFSTHNFRAWQDTPDPQAVLERSPEGERLRAALGRRLREATRGEWESLGLQIGHRYENSPICIPDGTPPTPDDFRLYVPTARPGARAPHAWLADGHSTLDLFGRGFVLLCFTPLAADEATTLAQAFERTHVPIEVISIDDPAIAQLYARHLVLVRPDGHVAWRGDHAGNAVDIVEIVRGARCVRASSDHDTFARPAAQALPS